MFSRRKPSPRYRILIKINGRTVVLTTRPLPANPLQGDGLPSPGGRFPTGLSIAPQACCLESLLQRIHARGRVMSSRARRQRSSGCGQALDNLANQAKTSRDDNAPPSMAEFSEHTGQQNRHHRQGGGQLQTLQHARAIHSHDTLRAIRGAAVERAGRACRRRPFCLKQM